MRVAIEADARQVFYAAGPGKPMLRGPGLAAYMLKFWEIPGFGRFIESTGEGCGGRGQTV
jgi:hypothetical protein